MSTNCGIKLFVFGYLTLIFGFSSSNFLTITNIVWLRDCYPYSSSATFSIRRIPLRFMITL